MNSEVRGLASSTDSVNPADYESYTWDAAGNRTSLRKRDGSTLGFQYDALNRMIVKLVPERAGLSSAHTRDVYYAYDLRGLQTRARFDSLAGEGVTNAWDGFGRLASSTTNMGGVSRTLSYLYDANGNRIRVTYPDGGTIIYEHDGLDRMSAVRGNSGAVLATFAYDAAGRRSRLASPGTLTDYAYDGLSRLVGLAFDLGGAASDQNLGFAYNPASQIVTRTSANESYAWVPPYAVSRSYSVNGLNQYTALANVGMPNATFLGP